jgi:hypothetical protein
VHKNGVTMGTIQAKCKFVVLNDIVVIKLFSRYEIYVGESIVDIDDYDSIKQYNWYLDGKYVSTYINNKRIRLHNLLFQHDTKLFVDHINGDSLDNRKINFRLVNNYGNTRNCCKKSKKNKYKGVCSYKDKFIARIMVNRKEVYLGIFNTEEEAAKAYDVHAEKFFGDFSRTNLQMGI